MKTRELTRLCALMVAIVMVLAASGCSTASTAAPISSSAPAISSEVPPASSAAPAVEKMEGDEFDNGAIGTHGGVSSGSVYASEAGLEILKAGGNAVDAAVATVLRWVFANPTSAASAAAA